MASHISTESPQRRSCWVTSIGNVPHILATTMGGQYGQSDPGTWRKMRK